MRSRILLIVVILAASFAARATQLPSSSIGSSVSLNIAGSITSDTSTEFGGFHVGGGSLAIASINTLGTPSPFLEAVVEVGPSQIVPLMTTQSVSLLNYYFQIVSPIGGTVPIAIDVAGSVTGTSNPLVFDANYQLQSAWALFDPASGAQLTQDTIVTNLKVGPYHEEFSRTVVLSVFVNQPYRVLMVAKAEASVRAGMSASGSARIDPIFSLGAGVDPTLYSFDFSDGIGNSASPVPLPVPLALLSSGLLALASLPRRRRLE